ncbi:MAG: serine protease [Bacteroidia bacterium]
MFANAYEIASKFTHPVLLSFRYFDKTVESGLGSFVILNEEGWILTAAHILDPMFMFQQHAAEIAKYNQSMQSISSTDQRISYFSPNPKWLVNYSHWWGADHHRINQFMILKENDLAIGKIENYNPAFVTHYPTLINPEKLKIGTSLCKLGYPFYDVKASFNESNNSFVFDPSIFPIPRFPIEGIFTRNIHAGKSADGKYDVQFIETSSPGLRGQSGGPIFDVDGNIWAIQSQTRHLPLGFTPKIKKGNQEVEENQFLNVGWGVHINTIMRFLDDHGVKYSKK